MAENSRKVRNRRTCDSIEEIVEVLSPGKLGNEMTWVGKDYSKADLIRDLQALSEKA